MKKEVVQTNSSFLVQNVNNFIKLEINFCKNLTNIKIAYLALLNQILNKHNVILPFLNV